MWTGNDGSHVGEFVAHQPLRRRIGADRHTGDQRCVGLAVVAQQQAAQRTRSHRQHHVVDRDAKLLPGLLDVRQRERRRREPASGCHHVVDEALRRCEVAGQVGMLAAFLGAAPHGVTPVASFAHQPGELADQTDMVAPCRLEQRRPRPRDIGHVEHPHHFGRSLRRHRLGHLVGRRHTVGEHVMDLVDDRDAVVGQALGDIHLPERAAAIQRGAGDLADQLVEFASAARRGHPRLANVIVEVDFVVHHPHRVMQLQGNVDELIAQRRQGLQPRISDSAEQVEIEAALHIGDIEHADLERVHVDFRRLAIQHQGVHAVESLHTHPIRQRPVLVYPLHSL